MKVSETCGPGHGARTRPLRAAHTLARGRLIRLAERTACIKRALGKVLPGGAILAVDL